MNFDGRLIITGMVLGLQNSLAADLTTLNSLVWFGR